MGKLLSDRATGLRDFNQERAVRAAQMNRALGATLPNFDAESRVNEVYKISVTNSTAADKLIILHPGLLTSVAEIEKVIGVTADGIAKTGEIITGVNCATKTGTLLEFFQRFVNRNPSRIVRMQVDVSTEAQLSEDLVFASISPFAKAPETPINPAAQRKETNNQSKLVTLAPSNVQLDDQTVWYVNLLAGATLTINLTMGVISNSAGVLSEQAKIVYGN